MPFALSPGVTVIEKDFTSIVPAVATSTGAFAGLFQWGPVLYPVTISSENVLVQVFGQPNELSAKSFFSASNFLAYSNNLKCVRIETPLARNAVSVQSGTVTTVSVTTGGSGYTSNPIVTVGNPNDAGGILAIITSNVTGNVVDGFTAVEHGTGYTSAPLITVGRSWTASGVVTLGQQIAHLTNLYTVTTAGTLDAASPPTFTGSTVTTGSFVVGTQYTITLVGNTDFTAIGASANTVGIIFTATGVGGGSTGTAAPSVTNGTAKLKFAGDRATATSNITVGGVKINNADEYEINWSGGQGVIGAFAAKYPGKYGNSIKVSIADAATFGDWAYKSLFTSAPGTSSYAANVGASNDELHVIVIEDLGPTENILETYSYLSKASDAKKADGTNAYYKEVINNSSKYIWWTDHLTSPAVNGGANIGGLADTASTQIVATGTIVVASTSVKAVVGTGTQFGTQFNIGSSIYTSAGTLVGVVATITDSTHLTLESNALAAIVSTAAFKFAGFKHLAAYTTQLSGGIDDIAPTNDSYFDGFDEFANAEEIDISLIVTGGVNSTVAKYVIDMIVETRKDCVAFVSPEKNGNAIYAGINAVADIKTFRDAMGSSSYAVMDSGYKYQYDRYNDVYRWLPLNGDVAGLCARTDNTNDPWFSPGGLNRGQIKNCIKLAINPGKTDRDTLYQMNVNPVVSFPGNGTVLFGDKTLQSKPSAFDRINVRRLFIVLEKAIAISAKFQLFEFNDGFTRAMFKSMVEPFLRDVEGRRGITDFQVVCDDTNNTGEVIDRNEFVADIYIKPARSINFITLNFIASRSGVAFSELGA